MHGRDCQLSVGRKEWRPEEINQITYVQICIIHGHRSIVWCGLGGGGKRGGK